MIFVQIVVVDYVDLGGCNKSSTADSYSTKEEVANDIGNWLRDLTSLVSGCTQSA